MARNKQPLKPFYTEGMTVQQILNLSPEVLDTLNKRDISRALRTVALGANKRIKNLIKNEKATANTAIASDSLNWLRDTVKGRFGKSLNRGFKFGVKSASSRNQMIAQITVLRNFYGMSTSTVKGARNARQKREMSMYGKTREQMAKGMNKKERRALYARLNRYNKRVWEIYKNHCEIQGRDPHELYDESGEEIRTIARVISKGGSDQQALNAVLAESEQNYLEEQAKQREIEQEFMSKYKRV